MRRIGVLVYASLFEGRSLVVPDTGVDLGALGPEWKSLEAKVAVAAAARDFEACVVAIESAGPAFARAQPRQADDVNELSDELHVA